MKYVRKFLFFCRILLVFCRFVLFDLDFKVVGVGKDKKDKKLGKKDDGGLESFVFLMDLDEKFLYDGF